MPGIPISIILRESIAYVVFLSVYAIIATHWGAYQSSKAEKASRENP